LEAVRHHIKVADTLRATMEEQTRVIEGLRESVTLYRQSHTSCISTEPQGLCNKCHYAEKALFPEPKELS
jgi:hypothetical protein